jgi:hypothetical protein
LGPLDRHAVVTGDSDAAAEVDRDRLLDPHRPAQARGDAIESRSPQTEVTTGFPAAERRPGREEVQCSPHPQTFHGLPAPLHLIDEELQAAVIQDANGPGASSISRLSSCQERLEVGIST